MVRSTVRFRAWDDVYGNAGMGLLKCITRNFRMAEIDHSKKMGFCQKKARRPPKWIHEHVRVRAYTYVFHWVLAIFQNRSIRLVRL